MLLLNQAENESFKINVISLCRDHNDSGDERIVESIEEK